MDLPETLAARLYLLAYDPAKERLTARGRLGYVLRAAALTELLLRGHLQEVDGEPQANARMPRPADPVLAGVLDEIAESRPRSWQHWVRRHSGTMKSAVAGQLVAGGWIEVRQHRVLGIVPSATVTVREPGVVSQLGDRVRAALRATVPEPADAALVALAAAGELPTVFPSAQRREHEQRIAALTTATGPALAALREVIDQQRASPSTG